MDLHRIMVGVDFSEQADLAVRTALRLARRSGARVDRVHVCSVPGRPEWLDSSMEEMARQLKLRIEAHLVTDRQRFPGVGPGAW